MNISDSEMRLMELIWEKAPVKSGELAASAFAELGWKKSTVYTVIKKLTVKGVIKSENAVITPLISRDEAMTTKTGELVSGLGRGSLPLFLTAFLKKDKLKRSEAEELKRLIDEYTEVE